MLLTTELITEWLVAGSGHLTRGENLSDPVRIEAEAGGEEEEGHHHRYGHLSVVTP